MGWLDKLVKPAIKQGDKMEYVDPEQVGEALAKAAAATAQPSTADVQGNIAEPYMAQGETMSPGPMSVPQPDAPEMVQPPDQTTTSYSTPPAAPQPSVVHPSLEQASTDANGLPAASTPGLTRLGKLFQILGMAAKGGLAGRAASERAVAESGGHRGGGIGQGFEAGLTEAPREATMQQGVERGAMENAAQKANLSALPWMRAMAQQKAIADLEETRAKATAAPYVTPRGGGVFDARTGKYAPGAQPTEKQVNQSPQQVYADAVKDAMDRGLTGPALMQDPKVQTALGAVTATQKETKPDNLDQQYLDAASKQDTTTMANIERAWKARATNIHIASGNDTSADDNQVLAQGLVDGTIDAAKLGRAKNRGQIIALAKRMDPSFDMTNYPARQKTATDFASGKAADQIQSFNTFLGHAKDLSDAVNGVRNSGSPLINKPYNWLRKNATGDPVIAAYLAKVQPVRDEFETFLQNNHALTETDRKSAMDILNENASPAQTQAVIKSMVHTAGVRLNALNSRYKNTMHKDYPGLLEPENQGVLEQFGAGNSAGGSTVKAQPSGSQIVVTDPTDGAQYRFPDQKSADAYKKAAGIQ